MIAVVKVRMTARVMDRVTARVTARVTMKAKTKIYLKTQIRSLNSPGTATQHKSKTVHRNSPVSRSRATPRKAVRQVLKPWETNPAMKRLRHKPQFPYLKHP